MRRLLLLLMMVAFAKAQLVAAPLAICEHADAAAHVAALESEDALEAAEARSEEAAASAAEKKGSLADSASASLAVALPPEGADLARASGPSSLAWHLRASALPAGRTLPPLLDPPLA